MDKEFIPYEQALALKELGFDEPCMYIFDKQRNNLMCPIYGLFENEEPNRFLNAPLYQQAFRWFREKYGLDVTFRKMDYGPESQFTGYYFSVYRGNELIDIHGADKKCKLYEDTELECLKKLISIVKQ